MSGFKSDYTYANILGVSLGRMQHPGWISHRQVQHMDGKLERKIKYERDTVIANAWLSREKMLKRLFPNQRILPDLLQPIVA